MILLSFNTILTIKINERRNFTNIEQLQNIKKNYLN